MGLRYRMQKQIIEPLQFRMDRLGTPPYQPMPWASGRRAKRDRASRDRWQAIEQFLGERGLESDSAVDLGCNIGFFCFSLAQAGIPTLGVEMDARYVRIASHAKERLRGQPVWFLNMPISEQTVPLLPTVDLTLLLAVWHHWVHQDGLDGATALLRQIWQHTTQVLFFESGENEMSPKFGLPPLEPTPVEWFSNYLAEVCSPCEVVSLGRFPATECGSESAGPTPLRSLFAVVRQ